MKIEINNLLTVRNYFLEVGMTAANIYHMINKKELNYVSIDGVKFIVLSEEEMDKIKEELL